MHFFNSKLRQLITSRTQKLCLATILLISCAQHSFADQWLALGNGVSGGSVNAIAVDKNTGMVYAGGTFTSASGVAYTNGIAKWDGSNWSALGTGMNGAVNALAVDASGNVYAAGTFTAADGVANTAYIAKWNGAAWSALGSGINNTVQKIALDFTGNLYATGTFTTAGGVAASTIAKWDGANWSALGTSPTTPITALTIDSNNNVYVGNASGYVNKWNGSNWTQLPHMNCTYWTAQNHPGGEWCTASTMQALTTDSAGNIYGFNNDSTSTYHAGGGPTCTLGKWNGTSWSVIRKVNISCGFSSSARDLLTDSFGAVYVGGTQLFSPVDYSLLRFVSTAQTTLGGFGAGSSYYVNALAAFNDGNIYAGGSFVAANGLTVNNIALWQRTDTDGDGIYDTDDAFPTNAAVSIDADKDGFPDCWNQPNPYGCPANASSCNGLRLDPDTINNIIWQLNSHFQGSSVKGSASAQ